MILPDHEIRARVRSGELRIEPYNDDLVQPASIDVRLDHRFRTVRKELRHIDPTKDQDLTEMVTQRKEFWLWPSQFALAATQEVVEIPDNLIARVEGKSSLGRLGLFVHITAGFIDPGFRGQITLELHNATRLPMVLRPGMPIAQLSFHRMESAAMKPYGAGATGSKYQDQSGGPAPSRYWKNFPQA